MSIRYPGRCSGCDAYLAKGSRANWDSDTRTITCLACHKPQADEINIDQGRPGASAAREWTRRHEKREREVRARFGKLGALVLAVTEDPRSTSAWAYGAQGERALGGMLDRLRDEGMAVLHDRRIPSTRANIDHVVVGPAGAFAVDAKNYKGRVERRDRGGFFSTNYRLFVGGRDKTRLIAGMTRQVEAMRHVLPPTVPVTPIICFVDADWSLLARPLQFGDVHVVWPRALGKLLRAGGPLSTAEIAQIERTLGLALPAAV
jgi:nuclease-like protein